MASPPQGRAHTPAHRQRKGTSVSFSGWRGLGTMLTIVTAILTIFLVSALLVSILRYGNSSDPLNSRSTIFRGYCPTASRSNLLIHLAINAIASGVLASSNFFMQVLVAPTREEVNTAHERGKWLEVGVQSWRNVLYLPRTNLALWLLFALSSVPLHLVFNGIIIQSKASTDFLLIVAAEPFLHGASFALPPITEAPGAAQKKDTFGLTIQNISASLSAPDSSQTWERIDLGECVRRYDDQDAIFTSYRHAVMVLGYANGTSADQGWDAASVLRTIPQNYTDVTNHLWWAGPVARSDPLVRDVGSGISSSYLVAALRSNSFIDYFDTLSGRMTMEKDNINPPYIDMQVQYCVSERFEVPCRLDVENLLLLLVCAMCALKFVLCVVVVGILSRRGQDRLTTPGDAIQSFIVEPDPFTIGMCTLSRNDPLFSSKSHEPPQSTPKEWVKPTRWAGRAIPTSIWVLSYALIGSSLALGAAMLGIAVRDQALYESRFGHDASNASVEGGPRLRDASLVELTMIANIPQLLLSMCYMTYNGLYTRMFAEFEWAAFSTSYLPLRVTRKRGEQRSTHRLQLPYAWSIPLILVSLSLHWLYSNTIYVSLYEGHRWNWPYNVLRSEALQYSTVAIVVSFCITMIVAIIPFYVARTKLPGSMVVAGGNTMVMSAACHVIARRRQECVTLSTAQKPNQNEEEQEDNDHLVSIATGRLKWGVIMGSDPASLDGEAVEHLGFGSPEQHVEEVVEGRRYAGRYT